MQSVQHSRAAPKWHAGQAPAALPEKRKAPSTPAQSLRPKAAAQLLGIGVATLWRWSAADTSNAISPFPKPRRLSTRCTVFDRDELLAWRDAQCGK